MNVVQSPEEFRNGPEVKIYIWEVIIRSLEMSGVYQYCTGTTGGVPGVHRVGPPAPEGLMGRPPSPFSHACIKGEV